MGLRKNTTTSAGSLDFADNVRMPARRSLQRSQSLNSFQKSCDRGGPTRGGSQLVVALVAVGTDQPSVLAGKQRLGSACEHIVATNLWVNGPEVPVDKAAGHQLDLGVFLVRHGRGRCAVGAAFTTKLDEIAFDVDDLGASHREVMGELMNRHPAEMASRDTTVEHDQRTGKTRGAARDFALAVRRAVGGDDDRNRVGFDRADPISWEMAKRLVQQACRAAS